MDENRPEPGSPGREDEWLLVSPDPAAPTEGRRQRSPRLGGVGLTAALAAGALVLGGVVGAAVVSGAAGGDSSAASSPAVFSDASGGSRGGLPGEQRLRGQLTAVGDSSVAVRTSAGTQTYTVTGSSQIVRNGVAAGLGSLVTGEPVLVHVYPSTSGGAMLVEQLFAGTQPGTPGMPPPGDDDDHDNHDDDDGSRAT